MTLKLFPFLFFSPLLSPVAAAPVTNTTDARSSVLSVDFESLVSRADIALDRPVPRKEGGMPIGNGTMGSLVWTTPSAMKLQVNRVDVYASNRSSNSFFERDSDYGFGTGFVDIDFGDFGPAVFPVDGTSQRLSVYDALFALKGRQSRSHGQSDILYANLSANRKEPPATDHRETPLALALTLTAPLDHQVVQRAANNDGSITVAGEFAGDVSAVKSLEVRIAAGAWQVIAARWKKSGFVARMDVPAGGWFRLEVRALDGSARTLGVSAVEHVGVGEIFVVAGQSNSANHGEERQKTTSGRVATFDGERWGLAHDPQPGASGSDGSFLPPFGDAIAKRFDVPVGFVACGIGASSVRKWLPRGTKYPNPTTTRNPVPPAADGQWQSNGRAFDMFTSRMKQLGPHGFRAVLWHQGESDANQRDPRCTLPGNLYRDYLSKLIRDSRREIGWDAPWFVAQASYHTPGDEGSPEIRVAQASLWKVGIALEGPDSDALKGKLRERDGRGVHFSGPGLRAHGERWAEKVAPWLKEQLQHNEHD